MTILVSNPTSMTIAAAGTSALATLAASMPAGSWAQLSVTGQDAVLGVGNVSGSMIQFSNSMPWNPKSRTIEIIGADHNWGSARHVQYVEASNAFVLVSNNATGETLNHGYDHTDVNPYTGDIYHRQYGMSTSAIQTVRKQYGTSAFSAIPDMSTWYSQVAIGTCWWSGSFKGAGAQGCWMIFNSGAANGQATDGQIGAFDPLTNTWFFNQYSMAPMYMTSGSTYHSLMEYSALKNVAVYGGGNDEPSKLWRLNADATWTVMPAVPAGKGVGIQQGNLVCDPVTGNFLLLSAGQLWELNPSGAGLWTQQSGARTPPAAVGIPGPSNPQGVISCALPQHGVVAYITQSSYTGGTFFLYKHA